MTLTKYSLRAFYGTFVVFLLFAIVFLFPVLPYRSVEETPGTVLLAGLIFYIIAMVAYLLNIGMSIAIALRSVKHRNPHTYFAATFLAIDLGFMAYVMTH